MILRMLTKGLHEICQETIDSPPSCCTELRREEVGGGEETGKGKGDESEPTLREDREVELLCPGEKESHKTDSRGAEAMGPRAEGIQVPSKDREQRVSKFLPVKSEQLLFMHLGLWFRKKKLEKRPR